MCSECLLYESQPHEMGAALDDQADWIQLGGVEQALDQAMQWADELVREGSLTDQNRFITIRNRGVQLGFVVVTKLHFDLARLKRKTL